MIPAERQRFILDCLAQHGVVSIADLSTRLDVSHMTVRRDIARLEKAGRVLLVSGGVKVPERIDFEPSHTTKKVTSIKKKQMIGRTAAAMISNQSLIYLDAGTTTLQIAYHLTQYSHLTVVTNDFNIASFLYINTTCILYFTGGLIDNNNQACLGDIAANTVSRFNFDIAFISSSSWTALGLTSPNNEKRLVKRSAVQNARHSVLVTDSSKYGVISAFNIMDLDAFDTLITDSDIESAAISAIQTLGVNVIIAR